MSSSAEKLKQTDFRLCSECNKLHTNLTTCPNCQSPLTLVDYTFFLGKSLGKYEIKEVLGIGGMGIVFKALHEILHKDVAVKIFISSSDDKTFEQRFTREARILAGLKHPNIIEVYDFDISDWGMPFYVMEYLEGKTLGELLRERGTGLPLQQVTRYVDPVIQGLSYAHKKGIIHRDLKPDNIFIERVNNRDMLKILDFGIAKSLIAGENAPSLTATETVLGTPFYLTPEQILNKNIGPHTDQYALALIVGEMLAGRIIREGKSVGEILYKEVHNPIEVEALKQKHIPEAVAEVLVKATMPKPANRFEDIDEFGTALFKAVSTSTPVDKQRTIVQKASKRNEESKKTFLSIEEEALLMENKRKRAKLFTTIGVTALVGIILGLILYFVLGGDKSGPVDPVKLPVKEKRIQKETPGKKLTVVQPANVIAAPAQAQTILSSREDTLVLKGSKGLFLVNLRKTAEAEEIPLEENILGGFPGGGIAFMEYSAITIRNFIAPTEKVVLRNPPRGELVLLAPAQRFLAVKAKRTVTLYRVENMKKAEKIKTIRVGKSVSRYNSVLSDAYFAFIDSGKLRVYHLESLSTDISAFSQSGLAVVTMACNDGAGLLAVGGKFNTVYLFDIAKRLQVRTIPVSGGTGSLAFFPGSGAPALAIAQKGKLLKWQKGITHHFITAGAQVSDIHMATKTLTAFDPRSAKIFLFDLVK